MDIREFENRIRHMAKCFKEGEYKISDKEFVYSDDEEVLTRKIAEVLSSDSKAIRLLLEEFSTVEGCEKLKDLIGKEIVKVEAETLLNNDGKNNRLDISISIGDTRIIIENKVHALDQPKQIERYSQYSPWLFYLTRFGHAPSEDSSRGLIYGKDYICVSYYDHIYNWLERLKSENKNNQVNNLWMWVRLHVKGYPEFFELILNNRAYIDSVSDETRRLIYHGYITKDVDRKTTDKEGVKRFCKHIVWSKLIPRFRELAKSHDCELIFDHKFEFASIGGTLKFMHQDRTIAEITLMNRRYNGLWYGVSLTGDRHNGEKLKHSRWNFQTLINYDSKGGLLEEIENKVMTEFSRNKDLFPDYKS